MSLNYNIAEYHRKELNRASKLFKFHNNQKLTSVAGLSQRNSVYLLNPFLSGSLSSRAGCHTITAIGHHRDHMLLFTVMIPPLFLTTGKERDRVLEEKNEWTCRFIPFSLIFCMSPSSPTPLLSHTLCMAWTLMCLVHHSHSSMFF